MKTRINPWWFASALTCMAFLRADAAPIQLDVDATDAPRNILHARMHLPARPGPITLLYPKWLPGYHSPDGPINELTGLTVTAAGKPVAWRRDADNMFAFHVTVPDTADALDFSFDFLLPTGGGAASTAKLLDLSWNMVVLYPQQTNVFETQYTATLRLPDGWKFGTALPVSGSSRSRIEFAPASLETLVDSPVIAGEFFRTIELAPGTKPAHLLHIAADSADALQITPEDVVHFSRLVTEANALFGAHHYRDYHFLLVLSDRVAHFGLEHHESSENHEGEKFLTDESARLQGGSLLPHEMAHSWNGKFRRPAGLATPDFQQPMQGELLWVYEGLTTLLGDVLATRSGLWTNADFQEEVAYNAALLDRQPGRTWRPLADTTIAAQLLYHSRPEGATWRRRVDFYPEGELIWLEADTVIRRQSQGKRSLDDFCRAFFGGTSGAPRVVPYTLDDVAAALNQVAAYDWREFLRQRVYEIAPRAPLGGIENAGWRLSYTNKVTAALKALEAARKFTDLRFSLGLVLQEDGVIGDVLPGSPAEKAGLGPAMKLVAVNGRAWSADLLRRAVSAATTNRGPTELLVQSGDYFKSYRLNYHDGEKYPLLERDPGKPDLLSEILKPLTLMTDAGK